MFQFMQIMYLSLQKWFESINREFTKMEASQAGLMVIEDKIQCRKYVEDLKWSTTTKSRPN